MNEKRRLAILSPWLMALILGWFLPAGLNATTAEPISKFAGSERSLEGILVNTYYLGSRFATDEDGYVPLRVILKNTRKEPCNVTLILEPERVYRDERRLSTEQEIRLDPGEGKSILFLGRQPGKESSYRSYSAWNLIIQVGKEKNVVLSTNDVTDTSSTPFIKGRGKILITNNTAFWQRSDGGAAMVLADANWGHMIPFVPEDLPENWLAYTSLKVVLLDAKCMQKAAFFESLKTWVIQGGQVRLFNLDSKKPPAALLELLEMTPEQWNTFSQKKETINLGMGSILLFEGPLTEGLVVDGRMGEARHWLLSGTDVSIPGVGKISLFLICLLLVIFFGLVGPYSFFLANRRWKQPFLLLLLIPAFSMALGLFFIVMPLVQDGFGVQGRSNNFTLLDLKNQRAYTQGVMSLYSSWYPGEGLRFRPETAVRPFSPRSSDGVAGNVVWDGAQFLRGDFLRSRICGYYQLMTVAPQTRDRIEIVRKDGVLQLKNGLGETILSGYFVAPNGTTYQVHSVPDDGIGTMQPSSLDTLKLAMQAHGMPPRGTLPSFVLSDPKVSTPGIGGVTLLPGAGLEPKGFFYLVVEKGGFLDRGLKSITPSGQPEMHYIFGGWPGETP